MKFSAFILAFLLLLSFSNLSFSQIVAQSDAINGKEDIWVMRKAQIKADILQEIESLPNKEQARYYASFGRILLPKDKKETAVWIAKALEIALNPATDYNDHKEKINVIRDDMTKTSPAVSFG